MQRGRFETTFISPLRSTISLILTVRTESWWNLRRLQLHILSNWPSRHPCFGPAGGNTIDFSEVSSSWVSRLFRILVAQRTFEDFIESLGSITFLSFNYDRCIQQFFHYAAKSYFDLGSEECLRVQKALDVKYCYGSIGDFVANEHSTNFGSVAYNGQLIESAKRIKTFTEGADSEQRDAIVNAVAEADVLIFLGFGFHKLNMELLFDPPLSRPERIIGTSKGLSEDSRVSVEMELNNIFYDDENLFDDNQISLRNLKCGELLAEYERFFTVG